MIRIFSINLKINLEQYILTSMYIQYCKEDDSISVTIHSDLQPFQYVIYDISVKIRNGYTSEDATIHVLNHYRKYVLNHFFRWNILQNSTFFATII